MTTTVAKKIDKTLTAIHKAGIALDILCKSCGDEELKRRFASINADITTAYIDLYELTESWRKNDKPNLRSFDPQ